MCGPLQHWQRPSVIDVMLSKIWKQEQCVRTRALVGTLVGGLGPSYFSGTCGAQRGCIDTLLRLLFIALRLA